MTNSQKLVKLFDYFGLCYEEKDLEDYKLKSEIQRNEQILKFLNLIILLRNIGLYICLNSDDEIVSQLIRAVECFIILLALVVRKKNHKIFKILTIIGVFLMLLDFFILQHTRFPVPAGISNHILANFNGVLEIFIIISLDSLKTKTIFWITSIILHGILIQHHGGVQSDAIGILILEAICIIVYVLGFSVVESLELKKKYEMDMHLRDYQEFVSKDIPISVLVTDVQITKLLYHNSTFVETFSMKPDIRSLNKFVVELSSGSGIGHNNLFGYLRDSFNKKKTSELMNSQSKESKIVVSCSQTDSEADETSTENHEIKKIYQVVIRKVNWDGHTSYALMFIDLTHKETVTALQLADQQKERVISTISHELKTPINSILSLLDMTFEISKEPEQRVLLRNCKAVTKLLLYFVNSILELNKLRQGKSVVTKKFFNLWEMILEIEALFSHQVMEKKLEFKTEKHPETPKAIFTDRIKLIEVMIHLVSNAIKFTNEGYVKIKVSPHEEREKTLKFQIEDTGVGIDKKVKSNLFSLFGKIDSNNKKTVSSHGAGLGLSIAEQLVRSLNPEETENFIDVQSVPGIGSVFSFCIPYGITTEEKVSRSATGEKNLYEFEQNESSCFMPGDSEDHELPPEDQEMKFIQAEKKRSRISKFKSLHQDENKKTNNLLVKFSTLEVHHNIQSMRSRSMSTLPEGRILVVDDVPMNIVAVERALSKHNIEVVKATSGNECISILTKGDHNFFLILMDIQMPIMDGIETTKILKKKMLDGEIPEIPIVAHTANNSSANKKEYVACGMIDSIEKPFNVDQFKQIVKGTYMNNSIIKSSSIFS